MTVAGSSDSCDCGFPQLPRGTAHRTTCPLFRALPPLEPLPSKTSALFDAIAHGDAAHRAWLKQAIDDHFAGRPVQPMRGLGRREAIAAQVVQNVCELPDYNSPDDQPDLVMCTVQELENCVLRAFEGSSDETECVAQSVYESAVKGRQDFRQAYRDARELLNKFVAAWEGQPGHENMDRLCEIARNGRPNELKANEPPRCEKCQGWHHPLTSCSSSNGNEHASGR